jgi:hypothetical protein
VEYEIYKYCAIIGCTLVGLQVVLQAFGILGETEIGDHGADVDVDVDHDIGGDAGHHDVSPDGHGNVFAGILSFKALTAFVGVFGLVGLIMRQQDVGVAARVVTAVGAGLAGMFMVGWMMRSLHRLGASGTVDVRNAVGRTATVYLRVPEKRSGRGKVTVEIQGRSMEFPAITEGTAIDTGKSVTVDGVEGEDTLKVNPV